MRYSLPIALALAAVTVAGASGTATAFNNNSSPWTAPLFKSPPTKPPKANTNQNPSTAQTNTVGGQHHNWTGASSAAQTKLNP